MPTILKTKNSVTTTVVPTTLQQGELAVNITDKKLWVGNAATTPVQLLGGGADGTFTNISVSSVATFGAGTVSAPAITTTGDTNTGIFFPAADTIAFTEGGVESMRIDSAGNVGIGTNSPSFKLDIFGSSGVGIRLLENSTGNNNRLVITQSGTSTIYNSTYASGSANHVFQIADTERMRIDSSGNVGIGTSSPAYKLSVNGRISYSGAIGEGADTTLSSTGTALQLGLSSTWTENRFYTGGTERMRIDSSGNVGVGTTSPANTAGRNITIGGVEPVLVLNASSNRSYSIASGGNFTFTPSSLVFYDNTASATRMRIDSAGELILIGSTAQKATGTTWSNPSDVRLKNNIEDYAKGLPELMQVKVKTWEYNGKGGTTEGMKGLGVVADEIKEILPDTVDNYKAKLNADDAEDTEIKKFDATEITWLMLKSIQEQQTLIEKLTTRLNALEGK